MTNNDVHILVVEDEQTIAQILIEYLQKSGFKTTHFPSGIGVVESVKIEAPDLILLDIKLPGKNGLEVCKEIRAFSTVPIFMVTAEIEEIDRLLGLELGADDYICKPFSPREVVARIKALFRRMQQIGVPEPTRTGFQIDEAQQRISFKNQRLDLTPTEYRLLKLLVSNPGRVYSRSQLLDLCYQQEQLIIDRVIDSHIKNLRKKISTALPPGQEVIHAVYGIGYRFEVSNN
uniref:LRA-16 n=1 Tax=uncultured bacterium BLR16 TaxID=506516 RepID=C7S7A3_9BACT|nr:LRA-16 [uncultured bacterium BLR16]